MRCLIPCAGLGRPGLFVKNWAQGHSVRYFKEYLEVTRKRLIAVNGFGHRRILSETVTFYFHFKRSRLHDGIDIHFSGLVVPEVLFHHLMSPAERLPRIRVVQVSLRVG